MHNKTPASRRITTSNPLGRDSMEHSKLKWYGIRLWIHHSCHARPQHCHVRPSPRCTAGQLARTPRVFVWAPIRISHYTKVTLSLHTPPYPNESYKNQA
eukprot:5655907-Amphidinium_carterae.1